tara:strand:+ start:7490 stop:8212 length:723 start_codon:yes stop_codon:yes gene_type:complete
VPKIDLNNIPKHIAIIMDGNGRWAKAKNLPRSIGHKNGVKSVRTISEICSKLKVKHLTLYTLSIENFNRPKSELNNLLSLLSLTIKSEVSKMKKNNIKFNIFGFKNLLPEKINNQIDYAITETKNNDGLNLNLALAYSSRYEILKASERIAKDLTNKKITSDDLNEKKMNEYMLTSKVPDPDLLIRTGGTHRLSNFLLWQCAYTELYFTNKFWPDFNQDDLVSAIIDYQSRERKFGTIKS